MEEGNAIALTALAITGGIQLVGWAFLIGILKTKVESLRYDLQEHKSLPSVRAHGNNK